ncbi:MAG: S9 family peptidase, partial [Candidatus Acidiferrales bacterium]
WAPLDAEAKAEQLIKARGQAGSLRWSPDGAQLAFVSNRGDHGFIGVFDLARKSVKYLDPSPDRDSNPAWSPDGKQIAFIRIPASRWLFTFGPKREAEPWSIRAADVSSGKSRELWRAEKGRGSVFRGVVADNQLLWAAGDRIVFPWEKTGWTSLYSVSAQGGGAVLLTPGEFEAEHVTLSASRKEVIYSSNQDDVDHRHLWRVPTDGSSRPAPLTRGESIEWSPVATSDAGAIAFLASDARQPAHAAILRAGQSTPQELAPGTLPADFPSNALAAPQQVIFFAADGVKIHGQLFLPPKPAGAGERPAASGVIFFHGGSRRQMLLGWHYMDYYHKAYALNQYLASRGYVVLSANYRSGIGYGMEFREALNYGAHGASEFNDVLGAGLYLRSRSDVDPARIGLWGGSYGGYLTALGLARASELFAAGVDIHGVHDWNQVIRNFEPGYDPVKRAEEARRAFESSPLASVKDWRSPVLLIHGDDDRNVPFSETVDLVESLREQGVHFEEVIFPDEVHDFLLHRNWLAAYQAAADFFDRFLRRPAQ